MKFWIIDGDSSTYDLRQEIKSKGGKFNKDFKCWEIENPTDEVKKFLRNCGLIVQPK